MRQLLLATQKSQTAITFVDALCIIRAIRAKGQQCIHYQAELLILLDHPGLTRKARGIIEQALTGEMKRISRQRQRGNRTIKAADQGKLVRMKPQDFLEVELKSQQGFYWEPDIEYENLAIEQVIGSGASPGYTTFRCQARKPGKQTVRWVLKADARFSKKQSLKTATNNEFYFELAIEPQA